MKLSSRMIHPIVLRLVAIVLVMALQAHASDAGKLELTLSAKLNDNRSIHCKLSVKNQTNAPVEVSIPATEPPFVISVIDANGKDLNQDASALVKRGKSASRPPKQQLKTMSLQPGDVREFETTVVLQPRQDSPALLQAGIYSVQARLVTVEYSHGKYETTLFQSNEVRIAVKD